jgi:hypothetical protein
VTAAITLVPLAVFSFCHQLKFAVLNTVGATVSIGGPKHGWKWHTHMLGTVDQNSAISIGMTLQMTQFRKVVLPEWPLACRASTKE